MCSFFEPFQKRRQQQLIASATLNASGGDGVLVSFGSSSSGPPYVKLEAMASALKQNGQLYAAHVKVEC
ncbi:hypothetical protein LCM4579_01020 [Ensifer sp. LCM 4579]|nr:hypothetical protein LCM4579_01020 [Ensifer sp. LCM 4579]